ncbi:MAG: DUF6377 domain-containing protein [Candidatus Amulumruptor caecigallinarius]|nr:DUF6377 domain-containing protein [Candidatus Amulumruptor caecigallinarius]MCM1397725.1 DUF6377 domain-containing protein [Candidatus Amulumruptor caecigallinarius]MCM1454625.1 DUF6377 domain-containing protein [bacterium]
MPRITAIIIFLLLSAPVLRPQSVSREEMEASLETLDHEIAIRDNYIAERRASLHRLTETLQRTPAGVERLGRILAVAEAYRGFNNDSALTYMRMGEAEARGLGRDSMATVFSLNEICLMPLAGYTAPSIEALAEVDTTGFSHRLKLLYHQSANQLYGYLLAMHAGNPHETAHYKERMLEHLRQLKALFDPEALPYKLIDAEYSYHAGEVSRARAITSEVLDRLEPDSPLYARMAYLMSQIELARNDEAANIHYLSQSAIADIRSATLEVSSLQQLGRRMFELDDINRAYEYLTIALKSAVDSRAELRITEAGNGLALIEAAHNAQISESQRRIYIIMAVMAVVLVALVITMVLLRREMQRLKRARHRLEEANETKEVYISQFLKLCSIYMDKLNQFCKVVNRKISAGKVDELYRMTKSAKFIEEQSVEFFSVFDNAFLHLYPDFVERVNSLLRDGEKITLAEGEKLNSDLRILAFMRLGIEESGRIAEMLHYSVNTIYAYRNKLKNRAINRGTFERDVMSIG